MDSLDLLLRNIIDDNFMPRRYVKPIDAKVKEDKDKRIVEIPVPGCSEEDVSVEVNNDLLTVKATVQGQEISKSWTLSVGTDLESIKAKVDKGLLTITIPNVIKSKKIL